MPAFLRHLLHRRLLWRLLMSWSSTSRAKLELWPKIFHRVSGAYFTSVGRPNLVHARMSATHRRLACKACLPWSSCFSQTHIAQALAVDTLNLVVDYFFLARMLLCHNSAKRCLFCLVRLLGADEFFSVTPSTAYCCRTVLSRGCV